MRKRATYIATFVLAATILVAAALFDWDSINSYSAENNESLQYVRARVVSVNSEELVKDDNDENLYLGEQNLTVELLGGDLKGEIVEIDNYLTQIHSILVSEGQSVIVCADIPDNAEPYFTIFNYDRSVPIYVLIAAFALSVILVGRGKGLRALIGVTFSLLIIVLFLVQALYHGFSPMAVTILTVLLSTGVSLILLNGISRRTTAGALSTVAGVAVTGIIYAVSALMLHLTGYNTEEAEGLLLIQGSTDLSIRSLLLVGVLISALEAVMDVAVSLSAALEELIAVDRTLSRKALFTSGMNIGKDMIGTMSNTLILAFAGSSLTTMISLLAYNYKFQQLFSSDFLAIELSQGICATIGVVLTVPITSAIAAFLFTDHKAAHSNLSKCKAK